MPDDLDTPALRRFARDLRRIREDRSVSLASIQEETQVQASHLESFEKGVLHEESRMNDVYLKAFVRAYAEAIGLSAEPVMNHLGSALSGTYDDELATAFLDVPPPQDESVGADGSVTESLDEEDAEAPGSVGNSSSDSEDGPLHDSSSDQSPAAQKERTGGVGTETPSRASGGSSSTETAGDATRFSDRSEGKETEPEGVRSRERGSPSRTAATFGSFQDVVADHRGKVLTIGGIVFFLVLVGGLGSLFMKGGEEGNPPSDAESVEKAPTAVLRRQRLLLTHPPRHRTRPGGLRPTLRWAIPFTSRFVQPRMFVSFGSSKTTTCGAPIGLRKVRRACFRSQNE